MKRKKLIRIALIITIAGIIIAGGTGLYMFNMPHRDVQAAKADYSLTSSQIVSEYLDDSHAANIKYLAGDGDSKILEITGTVESISEDYNSQKVVLLKKAGDLAGVSATFTAETNENINGVMPGQTITIKGVIRAGASYDEDLGFYENVLIDKSIIVKK